MAKSKGICWDDVDLGQRLDREIAAEYGVGTTAVANARIRRRIAPYGPSPVRVTVDWDTVGLGRRPDRAIAIELGVSRERVGGERRSRGISAFVGYILTQEGFPCRSIWEAMYDAYLHARREEHLHEVRVPGLRYVADFRMESGTYVEILGMLGGRDYTERFLKKHRAYDAIALPITYVEPGSVQYLYSQYPLPLKFRERRCVTCGRDNHDLVRGMCRNPCYMDWWRSQKYAAEAARTCTQCGRSYRSSGEKFCSHDCYAASLARYPWPSWEELDE